VQATVRFYRCGISCLLESSKPHQRTGWEMLQASQRYLWARAYDACSSRRLLVQAKTNPNQWIVSLFSYPTYSPLVWYSSRSLS
jgi:hypothetical protein